jgi:hypothetical protein
MCRWLVLLPACHFVMVVASLYCGLVLAVIAFGLKFLLPAQLQSVLMLIVIAFASCMGAIPAALLAYLLAPAHKSLVYQWLPLLLIAPYAVVNTYLDYAMVASQISVSDYRLVTVGLAIITPLTIFFVLRKIVNPAVVITVLLKVFKDVLSDLDKQVLTLQLGLLIVSNDYWTLMTHSAQRYTWTDIATLLCAGVATAALPITYFRYAKQLSQQGRDNSKLLNIINIVSHIPVLISLIGWLKYHH